MQRYDQCLLFSSGIALVLASVINCLDSSQKYSTENIDWDGQKCDTSPVVTDSKVAFPNESKMNHFFLSLGVVSVSRMVSSMSVRTLEHVVRLAYNISASMESMTVVF